MTEKRFNQTVTISEEALSQEVNGETVILDLKTETYFGLDAVGTRIWMLLNQGNDLNSIAETLLGEYEIDRETLIHDMNNLISDLVSAGLVTLSRG